MISFTGQVAEIPLNTNPLFDGMDHVSGEIQLTTKAKAPSAGRRDGALGVGAASSESWRNLAAFWLLGLFNNTAYVVMNAGAQDISPGAVGFVYLANVAPSMLCKLSLPYWAERVGYTARVWACGALMSLSFLLVAFGSGSLAVRLLGVACSSLQSGLGEASMLALTAKYRSRSALTAWSSGTGMAGVFGYGYTAFFRYALGTSLKTLLLWANLLTVCWASSYWLLGPPAPEPSTSDGEGAAEVLLLDNGDANDGEDAGALVLNDGGPAGSRSLDIDSMSFASRFRLVKSLWRYMVPLFVVYFAEYAMQSGTWAVIGFPVMDKDAREKFYTGANWAYQVGVFLSRSSGMLLPLPLGVLWLMPALQAALLVFFSLDVTHMPSP